MGVFNREEREHPEQDLTLQPQEQENHVNTVVLEDKNFELDWNKKVVVGKLME